MNRAKVFAFALGPLGAGLFGFATLPLLTWVFPPADIGRLSMLQVAVALGSVLFSLGLDQSYAREFYEAEDSASVLRAALVPVLVALLIGGAAVYLVSPALISKILFDIDSSWLSLGVVGCLVATLLTRFLAVTLRMQERGIAYSIAQVAPKLLFLAFIGLALTLRMNKSFDIILVAQLAGVALTLGVAVWLTRGDCLRALRSGADKKRTRAMLAFGVPLVVGGMMSWALFMMDRVMLRALAGYDELALYSVAASMASGVTLFASVFCTLWWPQVYKWVADGVDLAVADIVADQVLAACVVVFGLTGLCSPLLAFVLPATYAMVPYLLIGCTVAPIFYLLSEVTVVGINISRRTGYAMLASALAGLLNLLGNYLLVPRFGAGGAVIATMVTFLVFLIARTELSRILYRKFDRAKIYFWSVLLICCAGTYLAIGIKQPLVSVMGWCIFLLASIYYFRAQLFGIYFFARHGHHIGA
ncbi:MAG: oligosaccharide flippase family protein [Rhodanobacter sp.]